MKNLLFTFIYACFFCSASYGQMLEFDLTLYPPTGNLLGKIIINDSSANPFTGTMVIDNDPRPLFGWYVYKISSGPGYNYTTSSMVFYVNISAGYEHQQLFKGILSADEMILSGNYFYYGNEYPFFATRHFATTGVPPMLAMASGSSLYPNPVRDYLQFDPAYGYSRVSIFTMDGQLVMETPYADRIRVETLAAGAYVASLSGLGDRTESIKFIKSE